MAGMTFEQVISDLYRQIEEAGARMERAEAEAVREAYRAAMRKLESETPRAIAGLDPLRPKWDDDPTAQG